jgi:hypothetical protein
VTTRAVREAGEALLMVVVGSPARAGRAGGVAAGVERWYERCVAKDEASAYEGGATRRWLKVKQKDWTLEEDRWRRRLFE